jgi:hypothetical protein
LFARVALDELITFLDFVDEMQSNEIGVIANMKLGQLVRLKMKHSKMLSLWVFQACDILVSQYQFILWPLLPLECPGLMGVSRTFELF